MELNLEDYYVIVQDNGRISYPYKLRETEISSEGDIYFKYCDDDVKCYLTPLMAKPKRVRLATKKEVDNHFKMLKLKEKELKRQKRIKEILEY